jgi:ribA/ribD-fused uncharacterized protein
MNSINCYHQLFIADECCVFKNTKEVYGGLSNMAGGFPVVVNGLEIRTSEALFQMCRFPHLPDLQLKIQNEKSPLVAKWVSRPFINESRSDWSEVNIEIMRWCLRVKLAQNFTMFGEILKSTGEKIIVEDSRKNAFWGAIRDKNNNNFLVGSNVLGQLLMELRKFYLQNKDKLVVFRVEPPKIPDFKLIGHDIGTITAKLIHL